MHTYVIKPQPGIWDGHIHTEQPINWWFITHDGESLLVTRQKRDRFNPPGFEIGSHARSLPDKESFNTRLAHSSWHLFDSIDRGVDALIEELPSGNRLLIRYDSLPTIEPVQGWRGFYLSCTVALCLIESDAPPFLTVEHMAREGVWKPQEPDLGGIEPPAFNGSVGRKSALRWATEGGQALTEALFR